MAAAAAGTPVAAVRRFRPAQDYLGADAGGATFKLVRSGLAWGRATNDAAITIMRMGQIVPSSASVS
jgi:hypothetical protein